LLSDPPADPIEQTPGSDFEGHERKLTSLRPMYPGPERSNSGNPQKQERPALEL